MDKHTDSDQKLERLLGQALRDIPLRTAPATLESRVLRELQRRAALPWWQISYAHWPAAPRVIFVLLCIGLVGVPFLRGISAFSALPSMSELAALLLSWMQPLLALMSSAGGLAALLLRVIPPLWLYGGMAVGAMLYVTLFGLGAAAYRTLYLRPEIAGDNL